jgi:hypothetical protein
MPEYFVCGLYGSKLYFHRSALLSPHFCYGSFSIKSFKYCDYFQRLAFFSAKSILKLLTLPWVFIKGFSLFFFFFAAMIKHHNQKHLGDAKIYLTYSLPSLWKARAVHNRNLEARTKMCTKEGHWLLICSATILIRSRNTHLEPPMVTSSYIIN